jgi:uncharacterized UPF0160 family protein
MQTKHIVKEQFNNRKNHHASGRIVVLQKHMPWQKPIFDIEEEEKCQG